MAAKPGISRATDIPAESSGATRSFFGVFAYTKRALELVWDTNPKLTLFMALVTVVAGVLPSFVAYVGARILDIVIVTGQDSAATRSTG